MDKSFDFTQVDFDTEVKLRAVAGDFGLDGVGVGFCKTLKSARNQRYPHNVDTICKLNFMVSYLNFMAFLAHVL